MHVILCDSAKCKSPLIFNLIFSLKLLHLVFTFSSLVSLCSLGIICACVWNHPWSQPSHLQQAISSCFLTFLATNYHTHTYTFLFFPSFYFLSVYGHTIHHAISLNEWMWVFISERVRVWTKYKECCCVTLVFRTSLTEESKVLLWLALSLPLYKWNVVSFSTSTCSTVQLQNSILHSFFAFVSKTLCLF